MTQFITALINQWPTLVGFIVGFYLLLLKMNSQAIRFDDLKENINTRFDDLKESINTRFDDVNHRIDDLRSDHKTLSENIRADHKTLSEKVDTISAQVHRIEGALNLPRTGTED